MVALCKEKNVKLLCYGVLMVRENHHDLFDGMITTQRDVKSVEVCVHWRVTALRRRNNVTRFIITYTRTTTLFITLSHRHMADIVTHHILSYIT